MVISGLDGAEAIFGQWRIRRRAVASGEVSVSARSGIAQDATPVIQSEHLGLPVGERIDTMFIQTARAGTWEPKDGEEGVYILTLTGLPAQTVSFSDRPERVVGTVTTSHFLRALGFAAENPPNAALVTKAEDGGDDILVIELFNPVYTEGEGVEGGTLVYEARVLNNYTDTGLGRVALEQDDTTIPASFNGASLFIDDCRDGLVSCRSLDEQIIYVYKPFGCCWKGLDCHRCHAEDPHICDDVPECADGCEVHPYAECTIWG
jgi:hypothetical protein